MQRNTRQRRAILRSFETAARPLGPREVLESALTEVPGLGIATVYRTIKEMVDGGEIVPVELPGENTRYERAGKDHHHHFHCRRCEGVFEVDVCSFEAEVPGGFKLEDHEVILYGLCSSCSRKKRGSR